MTSRNDPQAVVAMRGFDRSLPMSLLSAREAAMRLFRPLLAEHEVTEQQWRVLRALSAHASDVEPIDAGRLADMTCLLPPSLSRILDNLETRGLVHRAADPSDQRRALLSLSAEGNRKVGDIAPESERRYGQIEAAFGNERLDALLAELGALTEAVNVKHQANGSLKNGDD